MSRRRRVPAGTLAGLDVLADAPEDAACGDTELLGHPGRRGPHVRGYRALDLPPGSV